MDFISQLSTPHRSVSQENDIMPGKPQAGSLKSLKQKPGNFGGSFGFGDQNTSRKKLSLMSNSNYNRLAGTPGVSGRRKLGNVSNTPQGLGGGKAFQQLKEDTFVKPSSTDLTGGASAKKKGLGASANFQTLSALSDSAPKLPTVYEDIEHCFQLPPKEFARECQPLCAVGLFEIDHDRICSMPFDESDEDEEAQKENRIQPEMTREEFCDLF